MGYHKDLELAGEWLASIQGEKGGWGLAPNQASSIVNTSEAVYVLARTGNFTDSMERGIKFIKKNVFEHIEKRGPRIRYVAFSLLAFSEQSHLVNDDFITKCCKWLINARNSDNGWGTEANNENSELFSSFLAIWSLQKVGISEEKLNPSLQWILSIASNSGWAMHSAQSPSKVATAYAILCLSNTKFRTHDRVQAGKEFLLQTQKWGMEEEVLAGTVWKHATYSWVIPALISLDENPHSTVIAEGIRYINKLKSNSGGWNETNNNKGKTVRAQFWSVIALDSVQNAFDPAIHVLRIDAERAQETLNEPEFIKILMHEEWATIIPSKLYKAIVYLLLISSPIFLFGIYRKIGNLSGGADIILTITCIALAIFLIRRRQRYFPNFKKILYVLIPVLLLSNLLFGTTVQGIIKVVKEWVLKLIENFS